MSLSKERILMIESMTMDLLREAYGQEEIIPPIDLDKIVVSDGLKVMAGDFKNIAISGAYNRKDRTIVVKKGDPTLSQSLHCRS